MDIRDLTAELDAFRLGRPPVWPGVRAVLVSNRAGLVAAALAH